MSLSATWILLAVFLSGGKEVNRFVKHTAICHNAVEAHWCVVNVSELVQEAVTHCRAFDCERPSSAALQLSF